MGYCFTLCTAELEDALKKAGEYEGRCDEFDQWLGEAETRLRSRDPLSIASQPLSRQEEEIRVSELLDEIGVFCIPTKTLTIRLRTKLSILNRKHLREYTVEPPNTLGLIVLSLDSLR